MHTWQYNVISNASVHVGKSEKQKSWSLYTIDVNSALKADKETTASEYIGGKIENKVNRNFR